MPDQGQKQEKLKRKLPLDTRLRSVEQEELAIKKQLLEKMNDMATEYSNHMGRLNTSMKKLAGSIAEGFALMRQLMIQGNSMLSHYLAPKSNDHVMYNLNNRMAVMHESLGNTSTCRHFSHPQSLFSEEQNLKI